MADGTDLPPLDNKLGKAKTLPSIRQHILPSLTRRQIRDLGQGAIVIGRAEYARSSEHCQNYYPVDPGLRLKTIHPGRTDPLMPLPLGLSMMECVNGYKWMSMPVPAGIDPWEGCRFFECGCGKVICGECRQRNQRNEEIVKDAVRLAICDRCRSGPMLPEHACICPGPSQAKCDSCVELTVADVLHNPKAAAIRRERLRFLLHLSPTERFRWYR